MSPVTHLNCVHTQWNPNQDGITFVFSSHLFLLSLRLFARCRPHVQNRLCDVRSRRRDGWWYTKTILSHWRVQASRPRRLSCIRLYSFNRKFTIIIHLPNSMDTRYLRAWGWFPVKVTSVEIPALCLGLWYHVYRCVELTRFHHHTVNTTCESITVAVAPWNKEEEENGIHYPVCPTLIDWLIQSFHHYVESYNRILGTQLPFLPQKSPSPTPGSPKFSF